MSAWLPGLVGVVGGLCLGVIWLIALSVLIQRRNIRAQSRTVSEPGPDGLPSGPHSSATLEPIRSFLEPTRTSHSAAALGPAPLSFNRYVEVRAPSRDGAMQGWTSRRSWGFRVERRSYDEAHAWWMMALEGADDRLPRSSAARPSRAVGGAAG